MGRDKYKFFALIGFLIIFSIPFALSLGNIALNKSASATIETGLTPASMAVDGDISNPWSTATNETATLTIEFGNNYSISNYTGVCDSLALGNNLTIKFYNGTNSVVSEEKKVCKSGQNATGSFSPKISSKKVVITVETNSPNEDFTHINEFYVFSDCQINCTNKYCGSDGCGGSCGSCGDGNTCTNATCYDSAGNPISPGGGSCRNKNCSALGKNCGTVTDNCGDRIFCGNCSSGQTCTINNTCVANTPVCTPSCSGKTCGSDGCGGSCGSCENGKSCSNGNCVVVQTCTPKTCAQLGARTCGTVSDGCGNTINCGKCKNLNWLFWLFIILLIIAIIIVIIILLARRRKETHEETTIIKTEGRLTDQLNQIKPVAVKPVTPISPANLPYKPAVQQNQINKPVAQSNNTISKPAIKPFSQTNQTQTRPENKFNKKI